MLYLVDGYNLLHAMGVLSGRIGPKGLERARARLLGLLHGSYGDAGSTVTVVFDARDVPADLPAEMDYHGIHVAFAVEQEQADDLIELLIRKASAPKNLTVVSDDHRIQRAARRRHCVVRGCQDYLEELDRLRHRKKVKPPESPSKATGLSAEETERWLREFGDLQEEPEAKELYDPFGFLEHEK
jgi:predicted RNA-binding protein with PIN domain